MKITNKYNALINLKELSKLLGYRTNRVLAVIHRWRVEEFAVRKGRHLAIPLHALCDAIKEDAYVSSLRVYEYLKEALKPYFEYRGYGATQDEIFSRIQYTLRTIGRCRKVANKMNKTFAKNVTVTEAPTLYKNRFGTIKMEARTETYKKGLVYGFDIAKEMLALA